MAFEAGLFKSVTYGDSLQWRLLLKKEPS